MEIISCIYKITSPSGRVYIGKTNNLERRKKNHRRCKITTSKLHRSFIDDGFENHIFSIEHILTGLETEEEGNNKEYYYWNLYRSQGYEMLNSQTPGNNQTHCEETKDKLRIINMGNSYRTGKKCPLTEVTKDRMRRSHKGKIFSESHKINMRLSNPQRRPVFQYTNDGIFVSEYISIRDAARKLGVDSKSISKHLNGKSKSAYGFKWKYKQ